MLIVERGTDVVGAAGGGVAGPPVVGGAPDGADVSVTAWSPTSTPPADAAATISTSVAPASVISLTTGTPTAMVPALATATTATFAGAEATSADTKAGIPP